MGPTNHVGLLVLFSQIIVVAAVTNTSESGALMALKDVLQNLPPSWVGWDPCGDSWEGIGCTNSHVTSITLTSMGLTGQLSGDIELLSELQALDLSYNKGLTGSLPSSIGSLKKLSHLSLNSNSFGGNIPPSIGNLSKLVWIDLTGNELTGTIPVSNGTAPGLDMLHNTKHFHFGNNKLSGTIPSQLFNSNMSLIHLLFESNQFNGSIPSTLGLVTTLEAVRLDRNSLSGPVPPTLNNLSSVHELFLSNNKLTGPIPKLSGMNLLYYLDMSNNSFDLSDFPTWFSTLQSLTTLMMEKTQLHGIVPDTLFSLPHLETVVLRNNLLDGTLDIGTRYSKQLVLIDLQGNYITDLTPRATSNLEIKLVGNTICNNRGVTEKYCMSSQSQSNVSYYTPNCTPFFCSSDQFLSPNCKCAYPYSGNIFFRVPSFSALENFSYFVLLERYLMLYFNTHSLPVDAVSLSNPAKNSLYYLALSLQFFPFGQDRFNRTGIFTIGSMFSSQTFKPPPSFGVFHFIGDPYENFAETSTKTKKSTSNGVIIGAAAGGSVLVLLFLLAGVYAFCQQRGAENASGNNPFAASWDPNKSSDSIPQLKGARRFSFEELEKCTNNFSEDKVIGSGGYGKVYRGSIAFGQLVAIKRAQQGSMQGGHEFKTEIELLSRVHHKNLVVLVGFCFEQGEQMLVYEYVPNGSLRECLSGKSGIRMDWIRRLKVALGTARGLAYLHELADPPIIHRDIKSNNILLDEHFNAKVADFGLSKSMGDIGKDHVTTQVKGTMGYMDPEYYMTQQLTEKSDVYSYGVVLLELVTAKRPIERGRYIVREVSTTTDKTKDLYNLHEILDPAIGLGSTLKGFERYVDMAMRCVKEFGVDRPTMGDVVKEIESIMKLAGLNPNEESASTSTCASHEGTSYFGE